MAFDPSAAYLSDWQYMDFIETGDYEPPAGADIGEGVEGLKVKRLDMSHPDTQSIAISLGLSADDTVLLVWNPQDAEEENSLQPRTGGQIILEDAAWVIQNSRLSRFGHFEMGVRKAIENADA